MKLSALTVSVLFSLGTLSAGVAAQDDMEGMNGEMGGDRESAFSVIDENNDGVIDREEARAAGIDDQRFDELDQAGDGVVTQDEYQQAEEQGIRGERDEQDQGEQDDWPEEEGGGWQ